ncbi:MAG: RnfABCDGE type electron transport complex subunit B [Myxococcales bacterium]|nr:MAG: RnfABCDGE type electron transport complex subunit B [Myxococcales bacterium]
MLSPSLVHELVTAFGSAAAPTQVVNPAILVGVLLGLGLTFGFLLSYADKKIAVKLNPLIHEVEEALPKGQCGACGYPGCAKYAEAVATDANVAPNLCVPGGASVAQEVALITGKVAEKVEARYAVVMCRGDATLAAMKYMYDGLPDCRAANLFFGGGKACEYGCLGFGNCTKVCKFDAIKMGPKGLPVVDPEKCTGCGACAEECPRNVIAIAPRFAPVAVFCRSHEKAGVVKKQCAVGCLGCGLCVKACAKTGVALDNFLPKFNYEICKDCTDFTCLTDKCKTGAIARLSAATKAEA